MTLERVPGLEDVEAGDGVDEKTLYDPHTWLDPEKLEKKPKLSLINFQRWIVSIKRLIKKCASLYQKKLRN